MGNKPLVSIVTPSFNQGEFIEETINSVLSQDYPNIEYLIMDAGSTDNTVEILKKYDDRIRWVSEPDEGQADAVNKGFALAKGDILGWLNSDDTYNPGAVSNVVNFFHSNRDDVMVYGDAYWVDGSGSNLKNYPTESFNPDRLGIKCFICQPSVFLKRKVFEEVGKLETSLQTCMDYEYWIRISKHYPPDRIGYLKGKCLANSRIYAENKTLSMRKKVYQEVMQVQKKHFGRVSLRWVLGYFKEIILGWKVKQV